MNSGGAAADCHCCWQQVADSLSGYPLLRPDDKGYWDQIEGYVSKQSEVEFTHGLCPDCAKRLYPS